MSDDASASAAGMTFACVLVCAGLRVWQRHGPWLRWRDMSFIPQFGTAWKWMSDVCALAYTVVSQHGGKHAARRS